MLPPLIRANGKLFTHNSIAVRINGTQRLTGVESIEWEDEIQAELVPPNHDKGSPLGVSFGNYRCSASISVYADVAPYFENAVLDRSVADLASSTEKNLTEARFQLNVTMREEQRTHRTQWINCRIVGRPSRAISTDGKAIVFQYQIQPQRIVEDGKSLVNVNLTSLGVGGGLDNESADLNYVTVKGIRSPGRATFSDLKIPYHWDINESYGRDAAYMIYRGRGLTRATLTIAMWDESHFITWPSFFKVLQPPEKKETPFVVDMSHPLLTTAGVRSVTLLDATMPERQTDGLWLARFSLIEWRKPRDVIMKPDRSIPSPDKDPKPTFKDDPVIREAQADFERAYMADRATSWH